MEKNQYIYYQYTFPLVSYAPQIIQQISHFFLSSPSFPYHLLFSFSLPNQDGESLQQAIFFPSSQPHALTLEVLLTSQKENLFFQIKGDSGLDQPAYYWYRSALEMIKKRHP